MKKLILGFITFLFLLVAPCYGIEITIMSKAEVTEKNITLGDIAKFSEQNALTKGLAKLVLSTSPEPGSLVTFRTSEIQKHLYRKTSLSHNAIWKGSPVVTVYRTGIQITQDSLLSAIHNFLKENEDKLPNAEIRFTPKSIPLPFLVPKGELSFEVIPSNPRILNSSRFSIIIRVDNRVRKNISVLGKIQALAPIAVMQSTLKKGSIITSDDVALAVKDITKLKNPCLNLQELLGKRLKKTIRAGHAINLRNVEFPPIIKRGQLVKIYYNQGSLQLTATGVAYMDGKLNDVIRVRNARSNKQIYCRVAAPGIVEVAI